MSQQPFEDNDDTKILTTISEGRESPYLPKMRNDDKNGTDSHNNDPQLSRAMVPIHQNGSESQLSSGRPSVVGQHFRVGKKIGEGSFGTIYEGISFVYPVFFVNRAIC